MNIYESVVGNIDREDIQALAKLARGSHQILEFGSGGSTQVFAQFSPPTASVISVDTSPDWQLRTAENLRKMGSGYDQGVQFIALDGWRAHLTDHCWFDLIFVDGLESERQRFAAEAWDLLMPGGVMAFHDCRWPQIARGIFQTALEHFLEVERIDYGIGNSNVAAILKKPEMPAPHPPPPPLEDWMTAKNFSAPPPRWPTRRGPK